MKYEINREEKNQAVITITVAEEKVAKAIQQAYGRLVKQVNIPGFRKGKAPRFVLEQKIGIEPFLEEAAEIMMAPAYAEVVSGEGLEPVDRPKVEIVSIAEGQEFVFKATVTLHPEVVLGEYKGLKLEKKEAVVSEDDLDRELERLRERHAKIVTVEGPIAMEDMAVIDYKGCIDGVEFEGGSAERYTLGIGSGTFIPGFEDQLIGHQAGDQVDVKVTFPEEYQKEELRGKEAVFAVTVLEVRRKELRPLDDEFAKDISQSGTLAELREETRNRLQNVAQKNAEDELRNQAVEALLGITEVDIPAIMIEDKIDSFIEEMNGRLSQQGLDIERYLQYTGRAMSEVREETRPNAERAVKTEVALMELAKRENLEASDEDIDSEIAKVALMTNSELETIRERLIKTGQFNVLVFTILVKKAIDFLVEHADFPGKTAEVENAEKAEKIEKTGDGQEAAEKSKSEEKAVETEEDKA